MSYALIQWSKLVVYCEVDDLDSSNAVTENAIRPYPTDYLVRATI
ncbi:hypothetical protein [Endozoicomonas sp. SCSIO W0465]